jgi:hypothetical protein
MEEATYVWDSLNQFTVWREEKAPEALMVVLGEDESSSLGAKPPTTIRTHTSYPDNICRPLSLTLVAELK